MNKTKKKEKENNPESDTRIFTMVIFTVSRLHTGGIWWDLSTLVGSQLCRLQLSVYQTEPFGDHIGHYVPQNPTARRFCSL